MIETWKRKNAEAARIEEQRRQKAITDYNIMMGLLEDPEAEETEEEEETDE